MANRTSSLPRRGFGPASRRDERGSVVLVSLVFVILVSLLAASVLSLSQSSYKLTMRNQLQAEARSVAESELEYMLFEFKSAVLNANSAADAPAILASTATQAGVAVSDNAQYPDTTTTRDPFLASHVAAGWRVRRSLYLDRFLQNQRVPGTTKIGDFTYLIARVEVLPPPDNPFAASTASVRVGRRFINSNTTIFQYSVFFQGTLEFNPGADTVVEGDVIANGSIYMGPVSGKTLTLKGKVRYLADHFFNTESDGTTVAYYNPILTAPVTIVAPTFYVSEESQLETLDSPENLLGGIDVTVEAQTRTDLFGPSGRTDSSAWSETEQAQAENNVYRSLIVPPPSKAGTSEYPNANSGTSDDAVIAARRAYTRAGLVVTVATDGTVTFTNADTNADVTSYFLSPDTSLNTTGLSSVLTDYADYVSNPSASPVYTTNIYDEREAKTVKITQLDIAKLKKVLNYLHELTASDTDYSKRWPDFNGLLYVNLKSSSSTAPAAVRLINATSLPTCNTDLADSSNQSARGFSLATNGGIYIKGDYNTTDITDSDGTTRHPASMLLGDAITVLSDAWTDSTTTRGIASRVAGLSDAGSSAYHINGGLLTGNIASTSSKSSGGAQNVIRYLENWTGLTVTFEGSLGRLFASTNFIAGYPGVGSVYVQPDSRTFAFDSNLLEHRPPGSPETTAFSRGSFFTWQYED